MNKRQEGSNQLLRNMSADETMSDGNDGKDSALCHSGSVDDEDAKPVAVPLHSSVSQLLCNVGQELFEGEKEPTGSQNTDSNEDTDDTDICDPMILDFFEPKAHGIRKPYECYECHQTFSYSSSLARHTLIHSGIKRYTCDTCNKSFAQPGHLDIHKRTHTGEKPYVCDICDKAFIDTTHLARHKRVHDDQKCYPCDTCHKAFRQLGTLKIHKRTHSGDKPFTCDVCNKGFVDSTHLTIHKRNHTGERPYVCGVCNKAFMNSSHLNRHKLLHLDDRPPTCDVCNKTFSKRTSLTVHKRIHTRPKSAKTVTETSPAVPPGTSVNVHKRLNTKAESTKPSDAPTLPTTSHNVSKHVDKSMITKPSTVTCQPKIPSARFGICKPLDAKGKAMLHTTGHNVRKSTNAKAECAVATPTEVSLPMTLASPLASISAASAAGLLVRPPTMLPFAGMLPITGVPMLDVNSALLRLPSLSKMAQMRDFTK